MNTTTASKEFLWLFKHGGVTIVDAQLTYYDGEDVKDYRFESLPCLDDRNINSDSMKELRAILDTHRVCDIGGYIVFYDNLPFLSEIRFNMEEQRVYHTSTLYGNIIDINNKTK